MVSHRSLAMSNNSPPTVWKPASDDPRVLRSTHALGAALVQLMLEQKFDRITVQSILERAGVGRSTFYSHFRNKHDVLLSSYEQMFVWLEQKLDEPSTLGVRIAPVSEFVTHIRDAGPLVEALRNAGQLQEMSDLGVDFLARMIERRIRAVPGTSPGVPATLVARMLAAALMEMVEWYGEHRPQTTPSQMDNTFHALARTWLLRSSLEVAPR